VSKKTLGRWRLVLLAIFIYFPDMTTVSPSEPISGATLDLIDVEIESWSQGRGWTWEFERAEGANSVLVRVKIGTGANEIAKTGYCQALREATRKILKPNQRLDIELYQHGVLERSCP